MTGPIEKRATGDYTLSLPCVLSFAEEFLVWSQMAMVYLWKDGFSYPRVRVVIARPRESQK